jgi:sensor c-di-GMP phosphodiesterase-like protein
VPRAATVRSEAAQRRTLTMDKKAVIAIAVVIGMIAVTAPIAASLYLAHREGAEEALAQLNTLASEATRRAVETGAQLMQAVQALNSDPNPPCSPAKIERMRELDVASSYLQAVGHVENGRLMCSSLGRHGTGIPLGRRTGVTPSGIQNWIDFELPMVPGRKFIVLEKDGYAAIVHPTLAVDVAPAEPDVSLALFGVESKTIVMARGVVKPEWLASYRGEPDFSAIYGDYLVAIRRRPPNGFAAVAAVPTAAVAKRVARFASMLVPLGIGAGALMAVALALLARQRLSLKSELQTALRRREFFLLYQPIIDLQSQHCIGAEALIRWRRTDGVKMRPDVFIPVAEDNGLMPQVTALVIDMVAHDVRGLLRSHPHFHFGINLSPADLQSSASVAMLKGLVARDGISPENVMVEATERGLLKADEAKQVMKAIRALGIHVAIDDFGIGYSSLSYLATYELDFLKIDKAFVEALGTDAPTSHVALHIIEMAKSLKLKMVAEGVETEVQATILRDRGVQLAQGWLFGKPMTIKELMVYVDERAQTQPPQAADSDAPAAWRHG